MNLTKLQSRIEGLVGKTNITIKFGNNQSNPQEDYLIGFNEDIEPVKDRDAVYRVFKENNNVTVATESNEFHIDRLKKILPTIGKKSGEPIIKADAIPKIAKKIDMARAFVDGAKSQGRTYDYKKLQKKINSIVQKGLEKLKPHELSILNRLLDDFPKWNQIHQDIQNKIIKECV